MKLALVLWLASALLWAQTGEAERARQAEAAQRGAEWARAHPARDSTGLAPLPDLAGGTYQGEEGGLYPGGRSTPPDAYLRAGLALAAQVAPLDGEGRPATGGRIVLLTIGMSNTTQETQAFLRLAAADSAVNPRVTIVDGAQSGQTARITADPKANYWRVVEDRLAAAGVTAKQVEAAWIKQANAQPSAPFPAEAKRLQADLEATIANARERYPNLKLVFLSSRIYAGYAVTPLNPEPHAYEGGFAVKWTIAAKMARDPQAAPWVAWGPYLWADGVRGRKQDGLVWNREDVGPDGTHPSDTGRRKVGQLLLEFLKTDATAKGWFAR
ncbi:MAG: SGNH/GDSL hydrolase family protein [Acidobacteriota bacterium]|nr:SGNH/GDSL hydrolase family protein [Acidobacteriota bacterium]